MTAMPPASPAEPHSDTSGYMALTASALDQLDAQVVTADERYIHFSDSKYGLWESTSDPHGQLQPTNPLGTLFEASKTKTDLESDKCKGQIGLALATEVFFFFSFPFPFGPIAASRKQWPISQILLLISPLRLIRLSQPLIRKHLTSSIDRVRYSSSHGRLHRR